MRTLTHSSMSDFKNCRKRYYYRNILELVPNRKKASLQVGTALHKGLESYYQGLLLDEVIDIAINELEATDKAFWEVEDFEELEKQKAIIEGMLRGYALRFGNEEFEEVIPEIEFKVPIVNPSTGHPSRTFQHCGKIDALVKKDGKWWLREFKTTSSIDKSYIDRIKLDTQITSYIDAVQTFKDIKIAGVIYTIIRKPSIRIKQKETLVAFCQRVIHEYTERLDFYFYQDCFYRSQADLEEWQYERADIAKDILEAQKSERWYKNTSYCGNYGGCPYQPLCCDGLDTLHMYKQQQPHSELSCETKGQQDECTTENAA